MSVKNSLVYVEEKVENVLSVHIYQNVLDGRFYLETEDSSVELPERFARKFAEALKEE